MSLLMTQLAFSDQLPECVSHFLQICNFGFNDVQMIACQVMSQSAGLRTVEPEQTADVFERETKRLSTLDESSALDIGLAVLAVARNRPLRFGQQV